MSTQHKSYLQVAKRVFNENKSMTLVSQGKDGVWAGKVYFAEDDGYIYTALERSHNYQNILENPKVFFVVEHGVPDRFVQGEGIIEKIGEVADSSERSIIFRKVFELVPFAKQMTGVTVFRIRPTKLYISDYTNEWKPRAEVEVTDEVMNIFQTELKTKWSFWKVALRAMRPFAFTVTLAPVLLGSLLSPHFSYLLFFLTLFGAVLAHAAVNVLSDHFDYLRGADTWRVLGSSRVLVDGLMKPQTHLRLGMVLFAVAAAIGTALGLMTGTMTFYLMVAGAVLGVFYTTPPLGLKYRALGDIAVFLAFGPLMALGAFYVQSHQLSWMPVLLSFPLGFLTMGILHGNNFRDVFEDAKAGYKTFAGILGARGSSIYYAALVGGAYVLTLYYILNRWLPAASLLVFLAAPTAIENLKVAFKPVKVAFTFLDLLTAKLHLYFSLCLVAGVIIQRVIFQ